MLVRETVVVRVVLVMVAVVGCLFIMAGGLLSGVAEAIVVRPFDNGEDEASDQSIRDRIPESI
jgi:hypothetical protein